MKNILQNFKKIHIFQYGTSEQAYKIVTDNGNGIKTQVLDENGYPKIGYGDGAIEATYVGGELKFDLAIIKVPTSELKKYNPDDVFVVGGAMFYRTMLPYCSEVLVTKVDADGGAEVFYENLDKLDNWECISSQEPVETNGYNITFTIYKNNNVLEF